MDANPTGFAAEPAPRARVPWTTYLFLTLLLFSFVAPPFLSSALPRPIIAQKAVQEAELTDADFELYLSAEADVRMSLAFPENKNGSGLASILGPIFGQRRDKNLQEALADYVTLERATHVPNMDRRILILDHLLHRPLNAQILHADLRASLRMQNRSTQTIDDEIALWEALYGRDMGQASTLKALPPVADAAHSLRDMHLGFLQDQALADLYTTAKQPGPATAAEQHMQSVAKQTLILQAIGGGAAGLAFLLGLGLFVLFCVAAATGQWHLILRLATAPLRLGWGLLLDGFLCYLALYRCVGVAVSAIVLARNLHPSPRTLLVIAMTMQIGTGLTALAYVAWNAHRRGASLSDIGLTVRAGSVLREVVYGFTGYCASLPLIFVAGLIARVIFRHNTNTTPNPLLPLMAGVHDPLSRTLIFLMASVAAPFLEETFFRGVLFSGLRTRWGWTVSAVVSSICFALLHPMQDWPQIFALGFAFATMREMRQSLAPSMTAHFLQNTIAFLTISNLFSS